MKLISMVCPQCSGTLEAPENAKQAQCPFCGTTVMIDDEIKHIQFDGVEKAGYDFENGRIKAQQDRIAQQVAYQQAAIRAKQEAENKQKRMIFWVCGWIFCFPIPLTILVAKSKKLKPTVKAAILVPLWLIVILFGVAVNQGSKTETDLTSTWAVKATPLEDFDYYVDGKSLILTGYNGTHSEINIASTYELDGKTVTVTSLEGTFTLDSVSSVIVPESVKSIADNTFNSCGIKYLYLPSTLKEFDGWTYFHNGEKLYYGGTEKQWNTLFTGKRKDLDFKQIVYEAKIEELTKINSK